MVKKKWFLLNILYFLMKILPVQNNKITFINLHSNHFVGNNKAIYEKLSIENNDIILEMINLKQINYVGMNKLKVIFTDFEIAYKLSTSRLVIVNDYYSLFAIVKLRKKTEIIQVWHGGGAFKKIGRDSLRNQSDNKRTKRNSKAHSIYSKVIVSCNEVVPIYAGAFGISPEKIIPTGLPRADIFFDAESLINIKRTLNNKYLQLKGKKIILYAPTFRDDDRKRELLGLDIDKVAEELTSNELLVIKLHPFERGDFCVTGGIRNNVLDLSNEDINDLLIISDILITDYSSVVFEYAILKRPMIFLAYDLEKYGTELRGFYYEYENFVPGPIVKNTEDLIKVMRKDSWDFEKIDQFARRFNAQYSGKMATDSVIEEVILNYKK